MAPMVQKPASLHPCDEAGQQGASRDRVKMTGKNFFILQALFGEDTKKRRGGYGAGAHELAATKFLFSAAKPDARSNFREGFSREGERSSWSGLKRRV
ncbi:MAG TPA: hypothetical protein VF490_18940 [Chryseosolibacter sp.]